MSKSRSSLEQSETTKRQKTAVCIIHRTDSNLENFIYLHELDNPEDRFGYICDVRNRRLEQPIGSANRMQTVCDQVPSKFDGNHGYHKDCYQRFTMNLNRLKTAAQTVSSHERRKSTRSPSETVLFEPNCIFCGKFGRKKVK